MGWSCDLLCPTQCEFDLGARRPPALFDECANDDDPPADRGDIKGSGDPVPAGQPQLSQLSLEVPDMRLAEVLQPGRGDAFGKPQKPRLHVGRESRDFTGDSFIEDFNAPSPALLSQF
jgi:hypothetical protein